jgi:hypothetical protein
VSCESGTEREEKWDEPNWERVGGHGADWMRGYWEVAVFWVFCREKAVVLGSTGRGATFVPRSGGAWDEIGRLTLA